MKFILFVEGPTEKEVLPRFLKRCLDPALPQPIGVHPVNFNGWANLWRGFRQKADFYLRGPARSQDIIAVISLMDLFGPDIYPPNRATAQERYDWAKTKAEKEVGHERFRQFFAVHELEAWLLSQSEIFPRDTRSDIQSLASKPEEVNFDRPPKQRLDAIYEQRLKRGYLARSDGEKLFRLLDPAVLRNKCPIFRAMTDEMIVLANAALAH